jgi:uncharacterized membrane protein
MREFFAKYIFHWVPEKAIYLGGHSLLWDARCARIYIGFGAGLFFLFLTSKRNRNLPPLNILLINILMFFPLVLDVSTLWLGIRQPSNDIRFLTGILFGNALCVFLYPAFNSLVLSSVRYKPVIHSLTNYFGFLSFCILMFFLMKIDNVIVFVILTVFSVLGFIGIVSILLIGLTKGVSRLG